MQLGHGVVPHRRSLDKARPKSWNMGGCQDYGPLLGPLNTRWRIILRTQKGTIVLTTAHMDLGGFMLVFLLL